jgi:D-beta-D-heptose 7-phosphate kinase/D-beta-D-heptose 1-phosphate adenosyltransferase
MSPEILDGFARRRAVVIGDAMLDSYLEGTATRLCREGPVPVVRRVWEQHVPGGAANSAVNLRSLGASARFLAIVGTDEAGERLRRALDERGVPSDTLVRDPAVRTLRKLRIVADGQYVVRFDEGDLSSCSPLARRRLLAAFDRALADADVVVVADYGYGTVSDAVIARLRRREWRGTLVIDAKEPRRYRGTRPAAITPNQAEAERAADLQGNGADGELLVAEMERAGRALLASVGAASVVVTLADRGAVVVTADASEHVSARPVQSAGGIGAGDAFAAALALALAGGADATAAARYGNAAAAVAVGKRRTAVATIEELRAIASDGPPAAPRIVLADDGALRTLAAKLALDRAQGRTVVFTNGVFDILHAGHVDILRRAKQLGDVLVVGVNSDACTRRLKGPDRPVNREVDRAGTVAALDHVDHVVVFEEDTPAALIRALHPHVHVKGDDYRAETLPEADAVREVGARIVILPRLGSLSTTNVIRRIAALGERAS